MRKPTIPKTALVVLKTLLHFSFTFIKKIGFAPKYGTSLTKKSLFERKPVFKINSFSLLFALLLLGTGSIFAQVAVPFSQRLSGGNIKIKGDVVFVGNNIINRTTTSGTVDLPKATAEANTSYTGNSNNNNLNFEYMDVDGDPLTFSSSSAQLNISNSCKRIAYAGLYWTATYPYERAGVDRNGNPQNYNGTPRMNDWNQIKFKLPGGAYQDIIADANPDPVGDEDDIIFNGYNASNPSNSFYGAPYVCYKNVTGLLQKLVDANGNYFVANQRSSKGVRPDGSSAGWSLVIIYESPTMPSKYISVFDGYAGITNGTLSQLDFNVNGFVTLPAPFPVRATIGSATLEGDRGLTGDNFQFKANTVAGFSNISNTLNPVDNFFNSTITNNNTQVLNRNPASTNTLGFDLDLVNISNPSNIIIPNNETGATLRLTTSGDAYAVYLTTFAVDIIEPKILLTKTVNDNLGNDASNANVTLGQELNYIIGFQNQGNDAASTFTIKDILPININFNPLTDISPLPPGVTFVYNAATRTIIFSIPNNLVEINDPRYEIRFKVKVVDSCNKLSDACSNIIQNQAFSTYKGTINSTQITDDPSLSSFTSCNLGTPQSTNFLVGIDDCKFTKNEVLCGASVVLTAANGYSTYSWSTSATGTPVIGTNQTLTVTQTGTYYVHNTAIAPCLSIDEIVTVSPFGSTVINPVIPFADQVVTCPNDGKKLPNIFLCGANASRLIQTGITDASSIVWEKLDPSSCTAVLNTNCANVNTSCVWTQVGTGSDFDPNAAMNANAAGQYRLTLNYQGGCFNRFYFNVYQNILSPIVTTRDIICSTDGEITVSGIPSGYEYSLNNAAGPYVTTNVFSINTPNSYTVYIRQIGVTTNPCVFSTTPVSIRKRDFSVSEFITQPACNGDLGAVKLAANDVRPQYYYSISKGGTLVNSVGPISNGDYTFNNLSPGIYTYQVSTDDLCLINGSIQIIEPAVLSATVTLTKSLTCTDGEITVLPVGGTAPYSYFVNSTTVFQDTPQITVTTPGVYNITVVDKNNCIAKTSITVAAIPKPEYTVTSTNILCYGSNTGEIKFNVTNANGYTLSYGISTDDGTTYTYANPASSTISNLAAGDYYVILKYSLNGTDCLDTPKKITITAPSAALTASGGVSELAGCDPSGNGFGKVRITNPQGGTPFAGPNPYKYSFDNQANWVTTNEAFVAPGTYTLYVIDANGCIFAMPGIKLDPEPVAPTITVSSPAFNCDGSANSTVTVTNPSSASFSYDYYLDNSTTPNSNPAPTPPNVFLNVPTGSHTITVGYTLTNVPTYSNLLNEDFGSGSPTTTSGIAPAYCFNDQHVLAPYSCPNPTRSVEDDQYSVASFFWRSDDPSSTNVGAWYHFKDHTTNGVDVDGRYLLVNIGSAAGAYGVLYSKPIADVIPNQPIKVDLYVANLLRSGRSGAAPIFRFELVNSSGTVVSTYDTGKIAELAGDPNRDKWIPISLTLNPGNNTNLTFKIRSGSIDYSGNDAVIDDIKVYQLPKACVTKVDFPFEVASGNKFTAQVTGTTNVKCADDDGTITIAAQNFDTSAGFQYSIDGITWLTSTTSPVIIPGLGAGTYTPQVSYDSAGACTFPLLPQTITAPLPLKVDATATPAKCIGGATVTATATDGTPAYSFELINTTSSTITAFPSNGILTNVAPGTYTVKGTDANGCVDNRDTPLVITAPADVTADIVQNTGLCFDPTTGSNITVNVGGGTGSYSYQTSTNGGTSYSVSSTTITGTSFTYAVTATGTYRFKITDSYGCTVETADQVINAKLTAGAQITKTLDCSATPAATIEVTLAGGTSPYTYTVKNSLGTIIFTSGSVTGPKFAYSTGTADTYTFEITDAIGCKTTTSATINPLVAVTGSVIKATNPTCHDDTNGEVQLAGGGGSGGYTYSFNGSLPFVANSLYTALDAKTTTPTTTVYSYQIKDSNGCLSPIYTVTLNNPTQVVASASIPLNTTCSTTTLITTAGAGGAGGYTYSFNGSTTYTGTNTLTVTNTALVQMITYSVQDSKGCTDTKTIEIPAYNPPTGITFSGLTTITCNVMTTSVTLTPVAGVSAFTYLITAGPGAATFNVSGAGTGTFTGLFPGNYTFQVTDANGCKTSDSLVINPAAVIAVSGSKTDETCFGYTNGTATFTVTGASSLGNYTYTIAPNIVATSNASNVIKFTGLAAGTYDLQVKDNTTGCISNTASVTINAATAINFTVAATKVNCSNKISTISFPTLSGGTPGYTYAYVKAGDPAPAVGAYSASTTVDTALLTLNIDVYVKDNNGCIPAKQTIVIGQEDVPTIVTPATQCFTGSPIAITIAGTTVGTPTYSIDNITYVPTATFTLGVGSHTLYIKDQFGCTAQTTYVVAPQLTLTAIAATDTSCTEDTTINLTANGGTGVYAYEVTSDGGTTYGPAANPFVTAIAGTYTFRVTDGATPACSAVSTDVIVKTKATILTLTTTKTDVKCKGDATGTINITPTSGKAPYTYSVTKGGLLVSTTANTTGLSAGTYDIVVTDDLLCNSASTPVIIAEPTNALTASATAPATTTCSTATTVTVTGAGGTGTYTYSFNGGAFTATKTYVVNDNGLSDQTVAYQVRDVNGCTTVSQSILVKKLNPPTIGLISGTPIYCSPAASTTSAVTVPVTNGLAPLAFVIVSGPTLNTTGATDGNFTGLAPGTYLFKVTDDNGCSDTKSYTVDPVTPIDIKGQNISNVLCNGGSTGIAKYTVSGFSSTANYSITVSTVPAALPYTQTIAGDVITLSNLAIGSYTVTVQDNTTGCFKDDTVTITEPPVLTLALVSNVNANCNVATSKVTVTAGGGTPGFTYAFMQDGIAPISTDYGPSFSANLNPTTNLLWDVWVKDAKGCETKLDVTILKDPIPTVTTSVTNQCTASGSLFEIQAVGASGVGPYTYTINTGVAPSPADTFTVAPGTYTITVKDANNCTNTTTVTVNAVLTAAAVLTKDLTCSPAPTEATIAINAGGGKAPYSYRVSFNGGPFTAPVAPATIVGNIFTTSVAGVYKFEVTDSNVPACPVVTNDATVTTPIAVTGSYTQVNPTCNGFTDGSIKLTALTGIAPFTYSITGAAGTFVNSNVFGGLAAGSYDYAIKDSKGCVFNDITTPIVLVDPALIGVNIGVNGILCNSVTPGSFDVNVVSGGTAPYVYKLYDNSFTQIATYTEASPTSTPIHNFGGLSFGDYYITVVDDKGCEFKSAKLRIEPTPYLNLTSAIASVSCATGVSVTLNVTGGVPNYTYSIFGQPATSSGSIPATSYVFNGLDQNTKYVFEVIDTNGCPSYLEVITPTISPIIIDPIVTKNVTCYNANNGEVTFTVKNYDASVTQLYYEIRDNLTNVAISPAKNGSTSGLTGLPFTDTMTGLKAGSYTLYVKETDGTLCSAAISFQITQPVQALTSSITSVVNANCNSGAQLTLATSGGTGPYTYAVAVAPATPSVFVSGNVLNLDYALGSNWNIIVKDFKGCEFPLNRTIILDPSPVISLAVVDKCAIEGAYSIEVSETTAGVGPYYISVNSPTAYQIMPASYPATPFTVSGLSSGSNTIYVKDSNGCIDTKSIIIDKPLELTPAITALPTCADNDGEITLTGTGGTSSYTYSILPNVGTVTANVISGLPAGTYTVTMTDAISLCTTTASVKLSKPEVPTFSTVVNDVTCFGTQDGLITVNLTGSNIDPVYTYAISPIPVGSVQVDNVFSKLPAGSYTITVSSARGCSTAVANIIVGTPTALAATAAITDYACNATNIPQPAKVTVNVTAGTGTGPYKYNFDGSANYYDSNELYVVDNGLPQTVNFYVKDFNGCLYDSSIVVNPYQKITNITFNALTQPTCPIPTQDVQLVVVGGYAITKYEILSPVPFDNLGSDTFSGLAPDTTYLFKVTDANGCSFQKSYTTSKLVPIAIVGELVNDISCNVANGITNNGTAKYTVTGFSTSGNYTVIVTPPVLPAQISQVGDVITLSNLSAGTYNVAVTDLTTGCPVNTDVLITNPIAITFNATATKVFCTKAISEITVSGENGGTGAYSYAVVKSGDPAPAIGSYTTSNILTVDTNLIDISWDVYVKDANDCVEKMTIVVTYDAPPTIIVPDQQCFTGGSLTVDLNGNNLSSGLPITTVYGGVKTYTLDGSDLATSIATFTTAGTYVLGIRDDNGCEAFVNYTIEKQLLATATLTKDLYCTAPIDATIQVDITDGVAPYSYQMYLGGVAVGGSTPVAGATFTVSVLPTGDYTFEITDSNAAACTVTTTKVTVTTAVDPVIVSTPILDPILCAGGSARMQVNIDNAIGLAPYTYTVTKTALVASAAVVQLSNNVFTGLTAGTYDITVSDGKGCISLTTTITISEPDVLTADASFPVNTSCDVATVITVVGYDGTPIATGTGYYYNFNSEGYTTSNTYTVNDNGAIQTITYTVKDANGCETAPQMIDVLPLNKPTDLGFTATPIYCVAPNLTSTVDVKATNGVGALTFTILSTNTATAPALFGPLTTAGSATAASFPGLLPGDYTFQVTDSNGCSYQELYTVKDVVKIEVTGQLIAGVACNSEANGKVTFTVSGFSAAVFTHTITGVSGAGVITPVGTDTFELTNLVTGTYQIDVTDNTTSCTSTISVFVPEPLALGVTYVTLKNANCNSGSEIKATANDGTPDYTYAFVKTGDPKVYTNSDTAILDPAFTWFVWAKDAHGCEVSSPITIITDPMPTITTVVATQCPSATGTYDITVTATSFNGVIEYSLDGLSFQSSNVFTVTSPDDYTVTVRDANQCAVTAVTPVTILEPLQLKADITKTPNCLDLDGEVTLTASGGSGLANYEYSQNGAPYVLGNVFTGLAPSATPYTFYVRDTGTLDACIKQVDVIIEEPNTAIAFTLFSTGITCNGDSDGTITINMDPSNSTVNNNPIYTYSINPSPAGVVLVGNVFTNLPFGSYDVTVTSGKGCPVTQPIAVADKAAITFAIVPTTVTEYGCTTGTNGTNYATITVNAPSGGSGTYTIYDFTKGGISVQRGPSAIYTETDLSGGSYTINVYDDKGCLGTTTAVINPFVKIDFATPAAIIVTKPITCANNEEIEVKVTTTGTTTPMPTLIYNVKGVSAGSTYDVTDPSPTGVFTGLAVGNYRITVTNPATGCSIKTIHYVNEPNTFDLTIDNVVDVTCFAGTDGSIDLTFIDKVISATDPDQAGSFDYAIVDALGNPVKAGSSATAGPITILNLAAGIYSVTATLNGVTSSMCSVTKVFTIDRPTVQLAIAETHTEITCISGNNDGSISVTATGGWPGGYEFQLELGGSPIVRWSTRANFIGLTTGNYTVRVRDSKLCSNVTVDVNLADPTPIIVTASPSSPLVSCYGDRSASITVNSVTGGSGNYLYTLQTLDAAGIVVSNNGPQQATIFNNLGAGQYKILATDTWTCSSTSSLIVITEPAKVIASLVKASSQTCLTQATLTLSATGGTGPYIYSADGSFTASALPAISGSFTAATPATFSVAVGTYHYYVRDANGCKSYISNDIKIDPLETLVINLANPNPYINCTGDNNGVINANAKGGLGNYMYTLTNITTGIVIPAQTTGNFTGLYAGDYSVHVDSGDCFVDKLITITESPIALAAPYNVFNVTCNGNNDGNIVINASGGTGTIKYAISPNLNQFVDRNTFDNLAPGNYDVIVQDALGCYIKINFDISEPIPMTPSTVPGSIKEEICFGDKNGEFSITISNGTAPYSVSLDDKKGTYTLGAPGQVQFDFTGLSGGNHTVYIIDANGCTTQWLVAMAQSVNLDPIAIVEYGCFNNSSSNTVTVTLDASITDLSKVEFALDGSTTFQSSDVFTDVAPGDHTVTVRYIPNGCEKTTDLFSIDQIDPLQITLKDGGLNEIISTVTGGAGGYQYTLNGDPYGNTSNFIIYRSGDYTVTVTDRNGCVASATRYFEFIDIKIPNVFTPNGDGSNDTWAPTNTINYKDLVFYVFDRYGRKVGTFREGQSWNGRYNDTELPSGDYWYILKLKNVQDAREFVGNFTLYR